MIEAVSPTGRVITHSLRGRDDAYRRSTLTGADGRFVLAGSSPRAHRIHVYEPDHVAGYPMMIEHEVFPDGGELFLRVPAGRSNSSRFLGTIVRVDKGSLGQATFYLKPLTEPWCYAFGYPLSGSEVRTHRLIPGLYRLALSTERAGSRLIGDYELVEGQEMNLGKLVVEAAGRLRVLFHDADDNRVAFERVWVEDPTRERRALLVAVGDQYHSPLLPPGTFHVLFSGGSSADGQQEVEIRSGETTEVSIESGPGVPTRIVFDEPEGDRWSRRIDVTLSDVGGEVLWMRAVWRRRNGKFELPCGLPAGQLRIDVRTDAGYVGESDFVSGNVEDGREPAKTVTIKLR